MRLQGCRVTVRVLWGKHVERLAMLSPGLPFRLHPPATPQRATSPSSHAEGAHCSVQDRLVRARASGMGGAKLLYARFLPPNRMSLTSSNHPADLMCSQRDEVGEVGQCRGNCAAESIVAQIHLLQTQHVAQLGRLDPHPPTCSEVHMNAVEQTCICVYVSTRTPSVHV